MAEIDDLMGRMAAVKMENVRERRFVPLEEQERQRLLENAVVWKRALGFLKRIESHASLLNDWEWDFVLSIKTAILKKWPLSEKQMETLEKIALEIERKVR